MSRTLETNSIPIPPHLAGLLKQALGRTGNGFDEAAFLQQLHYWTLNTAAAGWIIDGVKWIYNSLKAWLGQFPWMSEYGLRKAIANLKKLGLLQTDQHRIAQYNRVMFYRIDYERLHGFAGSLCDLFTHRRDHYSHVDVRSVHTSYTDTSSNTSSIEQQTVVVPSVYEVTKLGEFREESDRSSVLPEKPKHAGEDPFPAPSSGGNSEIKDPDFPELMDAVARAVGQGVLPRNLKRAIAQFPERVREAIDYLRHHQQQRQIQNPVGYLYEAIVSGWELSVSQSTSVLPDGFNEWFKQAKAAGLVEAAMAIEGVHYTLHTQRGWIPTLELMQEELSL